VRALILVDLQNDFVAPGALPVPDGRAVVPIANALASRFELVVATQDWHPNDHLSFASQHGDARIGDVFDLEGLPQVAWPDHCVAGTYGAQFIDSLQTGFIDHVVIKGTDRNIDSYSGFYDNGHRKATGMEQFLKSKSVTSVYVMGLATDYCVKHTAIDAKLCGFETHLIIDGCRGVELHTGDIHRAIEAMRQAGVSIIRDWRGLR
jgi:nicotinamidase/pyrazinamidase